MNEGSNALDEALTELANFLLENGLWSNLPPSAADLSSTMPFAVDCLRFEQWLQYVFLPRMQTLMTSKSPLPASINLGPAAEILFLGDEPVKSALVALVYRLDAEWPALMGQGSRED